MLSDGQAEKLLAANVANLSKKLREGKTLTQKELDLIEKEQSRNRKINKSVEVPEFCKTITELAEYLEVPRKTIYEWKVKPGAPCVEKGKIPVGEWLDWARKNTQSAALKNASIKRLEIQHKEEQVRHLKIKNQVLLGDLIKRTVVEELVEGLAFLVRDEVLKSGMARSAQDELFENLKRKKNECIRTLIEKNRRAMEDTGEIEPGGVGREESIPKQ